MTKRYTVIDGEVIAVRTGGKTYQVVPDPLGSVVALLESPSKISDTFTYYAYGDQRSRTGTTPMPLRFVGTYGYYYDPTGMHYVRARYYRQNLGRWLTVDPLRDADHNYAYSANNSITLKDPSGMSPYECKCPVKTNQQKIAAAINKICNELGRFLEEVDNCIKRHCLVDGEEDCIKNFCNGQRGKVIIDCPEIKEKECAHAVKGKISIYRPLGFNSGKCGELHCIIMHELLHECGHNHFKLNMRGTAGLSLQQDCYCSNCGAYADPNCGTNFGFFFYDGFRYRWNDCNDLTGGESCR